MARAVSGSLLSDVQRGFIVARVEILGPAGELHLTTDPRQVDKLMHVVGGSLSIDDARQIQGTGTLEVFLDAQTFSHVLPLHQEDPLAPVANNLVQVSFRPRNEPDNVSPYGRYDIGNVSITEDAQGATLSLDLFDNSRKVEAARFFRPFTLGPGFYQDAFWHLLSPILPGTQLVFEAYPHQMGVHNWDLQDDRLGAVNELATAIGFRIDWNYNGVGDTHIYPDSEAVGTPAFTFIEGGNARILSVGRDLSDEKTYNGVVAKGENAGSDAPPVVAEAWDLNPDSPTYFDPNNPNASRYGPKPFFYVSQFITTQQQAQDAANARLPKVVGMTEVITLSTLPHPGIIPGDVIEVERANVGATGLYVVQAVNLPLTASMMTVTCRERRIFS